MALIRRSQYRNSLDRKYDEKRCITNVEFAIGRYNNLYQFIEFNVLVSEKEAVEFVEKYLSEPMIKPYYDMLYEKGDLFYENNPWEKAKEVMKIRGDALGNSIFIKDITIYKGSNMEISCSS